MKNINKIAILSAIALVAIVVSFLGFRNTNVALGDNLNYIKAFNVSKGVTVSSSTTKVLDASSGRVYAIFVNDGSNPVYLTCGVAAVASTGIRLNASGGSYEINSLNQCVGQINAITTSSTSVVTVAAFQ